MLANDVVDNSNQTLCGIAKSGLYFQTRTILSVFIGFFWRLRMLKFNLDGLRISALS